MKQIDKTLNTYTVFCRQKNNLGSTWIDVIVSPDKEKAAEKAIAKCANDWCQLPDDIAVIGIAVGNVEIMYWEDLE